jgi:hypothetical protein
MKQTTIGDAISVEQKLLAVGALYSPRYVAMWFGRMVLQFYDREAFDRSARRMHAIYSFDSARNAATFRGRLDQILRDRDERPIRWEMSDA